MEDESEYIDYTDDQRAQVNLTILETERDKEQMRIRTKLKCQSEVPTDGRGRSKREEERWLNRKGVMDGASAQPSHSS